MVNKNAYSDPLQSPARVTERPSAFSENRSTAGAVNFLLSFDTYRRAVSINKASNSKMRRPDATKKLRPALKAYHPSSGLLLGLITKEYLNLFKHSSQLARLPKGAPHRLQRGVASSDAIASGVEATVMRSSCWLARKSVLRYKRPARPLKHLESPSARPKTDAIVAPVALERLTPGMLSRRSCTRAESQFAISRRRHLRKSIRSDFSSQAHLKSVGSDFRRRHIWKSVAIFRRVTVFPLCLPSHNLKTFLFCCFTFYSDVERIGRG